MSLQKYRGLLHRHRRSASHIIWIKSQSPWRTTPSAQHSHLPPFLPLSLPLLSTSSGPLTAHSSRPLHLEGSTPQISTSLFPLHEASGYHSDIALTARPILVTLYTNTSAPSLPHPNPRPLHLSPLYGSSSGMLSSSLVPSSDLKSMREETLVFFHYCIPCPYKGPSTHLKYL